MLTLNADNLAVRFCAADDRGRYAMDGVHCDTHGLVATDGKQLARIAWNQAVDFAPFTIAAPSVERLVALVRARDAVVLDPVARTVDGEPLTVDDGFFPPYVEILPKADDWQEWPTIDTGKLDDACRVLRAGGFEAARWSHDGYTLRAVARSPELGEVTVSREAVLEGAEADGEGAEVGLNPVLLAKQLKASGKRRVHCRWPVKRTDALVLASADYLGLVMPLNLA